MFHAKSSWAGRFAKVGVLVFALAAVAVMGGWSAEASEARGPTHVRMQHGSVEMATSPQELEAKPAISSLIPEAWRIRMEAAM